MAPHLALAENDGVKAGARESADRGCLGFPSAGAYHPLEGGCNLKRWPAHLTALTSSRLAVVLAAAIVLLAYQVVPDLTDLMMMPPPLSGTH